MPTTIEQGNLFARQVSQLLSYAGYQVLGETLVGHKKVDLLAENVRFGIRRQRVAVECKAHLTALQKDQVVQIFADYLPLVTSGQVDEVLLVTQNGLTPAGNTYVETARGLIHVTVDDLLYSIIDFRQYLQHLTRSYESEPVSHYYVPLATHDGYDLERQVITWLSDDGQRPLAILGSYGLGKTTFATHIAAQLAERALRDRNARVPILIRLADIAGEQSLEGLLGKSLTTNALVVNYSLPTFLMLNDSGRLVILLDGFDEMKHTLSWEVFRHNFAQLNRLVSVRSRVILLGRPTAFLSDDEHQMALHGLRPFGEQLLRDPEWPDYEEIELAPFNRYQVESFLWSYFRYRVDEIDAACTELQTLPKTSRNRTELTRLQNELKRIHELRAGGASVVASKHLSDIARRPVQLKMLAEILPQWRGEISSLTTAILYSEFIDLVIERELRKDSRLRFGRIVRREFARKLAWWMWTAPPTGRRITGETLPDELFTPYAKEDEELPDIRRDLVAACFLERKLGGALYWPHRSFQEFLVAEEIVRRIDRGEIEFNDLNKLVTDEVSDFMSSLINVDNLQKWQSALVRYRGDISWRVARIWISDGSFVDYMTDRLENHHNPWFVLLASIFFATRSASIQKAAAMGKFLMLRIKSHAADLEKTQFFGNREDVCTELALCLFACIMLGRSDKQLLVQALTTVLAADAPFSAKRAVFARNKWAREIASKLAISRRKRTLDLRGLYPWLRGKLGEWCMISEWIKGETIVATDLNLPQEVVTSEFDIIAEAIAEARRVPKGK